MAEANIGKFIFELGCEELPAGQIVNISNHIKDGIIGAISSANIKLGDTKVLYTPRRLYFQIDDIVLDALDQIEEIKGPPENISKDASGKLTQAALGFAKKNNLQEQDLYFQDGYLYARKTSKGQTAKSILEKSIPEIVASTPGVRFMRWGHGEVKFARPLQWIVAFLMSSKGEKQILDFAIEGLKAGDISYGHRFLGPQAITVSEPSAYFKQLEAQGVIIDFEQRKRTIVDKANALAKSIGGKVVFDETLLAEVCLITENPNPILCNFDQKFLAIPDCVLKTVMIHHQRYLPIECDSVDSYCSEHKLMPCFIAVSNNPLEKAKANIKAGNEKVIVPRFKDAEFFVTEDMKLSLEERLEKLRKLNFLKGTMLVKAERLQKITDFIITELDRYFHTNPHKGPQDKLDPESKAAIKQAALLSKCDLSTNLVFEFTELQGEIGGVYAAKAGLSDVIVKAISDHYKPRFAGDEIPSTIGGKIIAIADKIDNIVCSFALGKIPSGSADPFALRRQANGFLEIILHSHLVLDISALVDHVCKLQEAEFGSGEIVTKIKGRGKDRQEVQVAELNWNGTAEEVKEFLKQRLEFVFELCHKNKEINRAVIAHGDPLSDLNKRHMMVHLLYGIKERPDDYKLFVEAASRVINIARAETNANTKIDKELFEGEYEQKFYEAIQNLTVTERQNYAYEPILSTQQVLKLVKPINEFFDNVLVNAEREEIRRNRKALVAYASSLLNEIGDFSLL